ncbi:MAG TPA: AgmX/PglI C-terminal domain-containing protein [Minicystis sp.]|nr:AgmX/PglI C-terminal domain-containing protein [Minicystis sp.]
MKSSASSSRTGCSAAERAALAAAALALAACAVGCGGAEPAAKEATDAPQEAEAQPKKKSGFGVQQELGELDEKKTTATFDEVSGKLQKCFADGVGRLPYLSGEVRLVVRIAESGSARWAFAKDSTLGDRATEDCMLSVLKSASWPKPVGGEGVAEKGLSFDPGGDERPPVAWTPDRLGPALAKAKDAIAGCRRDAGTGPLGVTLYVNTDGKAEGVGVSGTDEKSEKAAPCVVSALRAMTFPSPGSWAAKVTLPPE